MNVFAITNHAHVAVEEQETKITQRLSGTVDPDIVSDMDRDRDTSP